MKTHFKAIGLAAFALAWPCLIHAANVTGKWKSEFDSQIGHLIYVYDLKADGEKLTGKALRNQDAEKSETEIKEGKVSGDNVGFVEVLRRDDLEIRIEYQGKLAGDEIKFTRKVGDFATMEIVAKRETAAAPSATKAVQLKVVKADSEEIEGENGRGENAIDGDVGTFWHTAWDTSVVLPHEIILELNPATRIKGFTYLPRQDESLNGQIKDFELYVSDDGKNFGQPVKKGTWDDTKSKKIVTFDTLQCRFIKLKAVSEINDATWASAAEIGVVPD